MKNIISFNLYFIIIFNVAICQLARTSYVDRGIRELKRDIEYDIKRLERYKC